MNNSKIKDDVSVIVQLINKVTLIVVYVDHVECGGDFNDSILKKQK